MAGDMKNIIILGSGRSGTSSLAGLFAKSGYYMGKNLYPGRKTNPKGFFEAMEINSLNEEILKKSLPGRKKLFGKEYRKHLPTKNQRWLAKMPLGHNLKVGEDEIARIKTQCAQQPFCYKDPRFSYTIPAWRPYMDLENTVFLVIFRHPFNTATSIMNEIRDSKYLHDFNFKMEDALEVFQLMYRHAIKNSEEFGKWMFLHYEQLLDESVMDQLESFTGAKLDRDFMDKSLFRNRTKEDCSEETMVVYRTLCKLANYS